MEESHNFGHEHPLVLLDEELIKNGSEQANCSRCGEKVSAPSFSCLECRFYLHKKCAEAPLEINHPFHCDHPLVLLQNSPYASGSGGYICNFCNEKGKMFVYHCYCELDFHIKCALFTYNIAERNFKELEHVAHEDRLSSTENNIAEDIRKCFGCWEPLTNYTYFALDCGINLHKRCYELPLKMNPLWHREHPLVLQFSHGQHFCKICNTENFRWRGFVYCCSSCKFVAHIECVSVSPLPVVEDKSHQHPFTLFWRQVPFICDACGTEGNYYAYICCTCSIIVHKKCISLPRIIESRWHDDHHIFHRYFLPEEDLKSSNCLICHDKVNLKHGSYSCSDCNIIFHVNCVTKDKRLYSVVSVENEDEKSSKTLEFLPDIKSSCVIERNNAGEATKIKHFKHIHNLTISDKIGEYDKCCDGCMLPVSHSFYHCSQCDFFLHKACADLPKMKHFWHHSCQPALILTSGYVYLCITCWKWSSGFAYNCNECKRHICLRCVIALTPGALTCQEHEHYLLYYKEYVGQCSACGGNTYGALCCKGCNFALHSECFSLPITAQHKCDEHLLALTYHDGNNYSKCHYCDICEERRDPNHWFYHCATCDTSAHIDCVLGGYPFIKIESIYEEERIHPHPLTFVKKIYYYPNCVKCGKPCHQDLSLECAKSGCNYIVHLACVGIYANSW